MARITGTLHEDLFTFITISSSVLLRMKNISDKNCRENRLHILCSISSPPPSENRAVYEIMWKDNVQQDRPQMTTWRMRIACWIPKATNTHSVYVIFIAFPLQKWLHNCASISRYTHIYFSCLSALHDYQSEIGLSGREDQPFH